MWILASRQVGAWAYLDFLRFLLLFAKYKGSAACHVLRKCGDSQGAGRVNTQSNDSHILIAKCHSWLEPLLGVMIMSWKRRFQQRDASVEQMNCDSWISSLALTSVDCCQFCLCAWAAFLFFSFYLCFNLASLSSCQMEVSNKTHDVQRAELWCDTLVTLWRLQSAQFEGVSD